MALADRLSEQGRCEEALEALDTMAGIMDPQWEAEDPQAAVALTLKRAHLFRKLGKEVWAWSTTVEVVHTVAQ